MPLQPRARVGESKTNKTEQHQMQQVLQMLHNIQDMVKKLLPSLPTGGDILNEQNVEVPAGEVGGDGGRGGDHGGSGAGGHNQGHEPQQHDEHLKNKNVSEGEDPPHISQFDTLQHCELVNKFLKLKLPKFMGTEDPSDANAWISKIRKAFDILGQPPEWQVCFAVFLLDGFAYQWWECMKGSDEDSISWEHFVSLFKEHFGVNAWKEQKKNEFVDLKQGGMTVSEYRWKFNDLSYFATSMIPTEEDRLWWFKRGLRPDILTYMAPFPALTLADYADRAARFETVHNEIVGHRDTCSFEQVGHNDKPRSRKKRRDTTRLSSMQLLYNPYNTWSGLLLLVPASPVWLQKKNAWELQGKQSLGSMLRRVMSAGNQDILRRIVHLEQLLLKMINSTSALRGIFLRKRAYFFVSSSVLVDECIQSGTFFLGHLS